MHTHDVSLHIPPVRCLAEEAKPRFTDVKLKCADIDQMSHIGQVGCGLSCDHTSVRVGDDHCGAVNIFNSLTDDFGVVQEPKTWAP